MKSQLSFWKEPVGNLPLQKPVVLRPTSSISEAIAAMQKRKTGCVLIQDSDGNLVGIFTERDVMGKFVATDLSGDTPVQQVMTPDPITLPPDTSVSKAINFFGEKDFRHLPICGEDRKVLGLLSVRVMVDFMAENLPGEVLNLPP